MTLRSRSLSTAGHSPLRTPTRSALDGDMASLASLAPLHASGNNHSNLSVHSTTGARSSRLYASKKGGDIDAAGSSVLDQLHAEQKSTIEALTYQIEFYRQREERAKKEVETLRTFVQNGSSDEAVSVARLAREARSLGDEVDALRSQQLAWRDEKRRLQRHTNELEQQLQDAKLSLTAFAQAVEQLELKMQRRDAEEQTRALEAEQEMRHRDEEHATMRRECDALKAEVRAMHTAQDENERLRREVQTLSTATTTLRSDAEATTMKMKSEVRALQQRLSDAESLTRQREATIGELQTKLVQVTTECSSLRVELEKKVADVRELDQKLHRSSELLELREKLLTSDASTKQESETQRHELRQQIHALEREKMALQNDVVARERQLESATKEIEAMKSRLMAKDHGVLVATLRSEITGVKERLRTEFKHEKDALVAEKVSLSKEITLLNTRLSEKERFIRRLQDEMLGKESSEQHAAREMSVLKSTIHRLETEIASAQNRYQQLLDARTSLADQLDYGFKELLEDENTAASMLQQVEKLQNELSEVKHQLATSEARRNAVSIELQASKQEQEHISSALRKKIDELYEELRKRDQAAFEAKQSEMKVYLLEQEKQNFQSTMDNLRTEFDNRIGHEQEAAIKLREMISTLKTEKAQQHAKIIAIEDDIRARDDTIEELKSSVSEKVIQLEATVVQATKLQDQIRELENELDVNRATISSNLEEKGKRERKLLRERRTLEEQVAKLVGRIEGASNRNGDLGEKIISLMKQLKGYEAEIVATKTQLKAEKQKRIEVDRALASVQRNAGQDAESSEDLKRRLHEITSLKESYQGEVHQLKRSLDRAQSEKDVLHRQRDEAIKRVSMLMRCQEQMKSTVESHTAELIEEIETVQGQLDDERQRTTVLLANEKTLLRDITEKNAAIARLEQTVVAMKQQQQRVHSNGIPPELRKSSPRDGRYASFPSSGSPTAGGPTTPKTSNSSVVSSSTQELDRLLGSLERISEFSTRSPSGSLAP